jgi:hypothetical protein
MSVGSKSKLRRTMPERTSNSSSHLKVVVKQDSCPLHVERNRRRACQPTTAEARLQSSATPVAAQRAPCPRYSTSRQQPAGTVIQYLKDSYNLPTRLSWDMTCDFGPPVWADLGRNWADLDGPQIYHLSFYLFAVCPRNTKCPRMGLRIGLRG